MKIKQLVLLILIAGALGAAVWHLNKQSTETWSDTGGGAGGKVVAFPVNEVARLTIQSSEGAVNLTLKGGTWAVEERADYPANFERVGNLLKKLWDLKAVQEIKVGPSQLTRFDLTDPSQKAGKATRVNFRDKDGKPLAALLVGKKFMKKSDAAPGPFGSDGGFPAGRYVMPPGSSAVALISDTLDDVEAKPASWLNHDFIRIEGASSVALDGPTDAQKWRITRDSATSDWKLAGASATEKTDQAKAAPVGNFFANPIFTDVLNPDAKPADTGLDKPVTVTITTFDGFSYVLKIGKANGENRPVTVAVSAQFAKERKPGKDEKPEDKKKLDDEFAAKLKRLGDKLAAEKKFAGRPFLVTNAAVDAILRDRSALIEQKPATAPAAPPQPPRNIPPGSGFPPSPPAPGAKIATPPHPPITVTTPPIAVPPMPPAQPSTPPAKPAPVTVTTPPVTIPPTPRPPQPPAVPDSPAKPAVPTPPPTPPSPVPQPPSGK